MWTECLNSTREKVRAVVRRKMRPPACSMFGNRLVANMRRKAGYSKKNLILYAKRYSLFRVGPILILTLTIKSTPKLD